MDITEGSELRYAKMGKRKWLRHTIAGAVVFYMIWRLLVTSPPFNSHSDWLLCCEYDDPHDISCLIRQGCAGCIPTFLWVPFILTAFKKRHPSSLIFVGYTPYVSPMPSPTASISLTRLSPPGMLEHFLSRRRGLKWSYYLGRHHVYHHVPNIRHATKLLSFQNQF